MSLVLEPKAWSIRLGFAENVIDMAAASPDLGEAKEQFVAVGGPTDVVMGMNPDYLKDALRGIAMDKVTLGFKTPSDPLIVSVPDSFTAVLMPVRVS
jgi:DNA polymerase-3 subunit beta